MWCLLPENVDRSLGLIYCLCIRGRSGVFVSKNADQSLGVILFVYQEMWWSVDYQNSGLVIRFVTVCSLGNVEECLLPKMRTNCYCLCNRKCSVGVCYQKMWTGH